MNNHRVGTGTNIIISAALKTMNIKSNRLIVTLFHFTQEAKNHYSNNYR